MTPIEAFFFDNNIDVWKTTNTGVVTYFSTSDGEFFQDEKERLFKIEEGSKIPVGLLRKSDTADKDSNQLNHYRREQLILKMAYDAMIKARLNVHDMKKHRVYQEDGHLHWKLAEAREKAEEFSKLYDDLARERVVLIEAEKEKMPTSVAPEVSK